MNANLIDDELTAFAFPVNDLQLDLADRCAGHATPRQRERHSRTVFGGFTRFEPVTVGAAARVLRLQREGVVSEREAAFYVSELAAMDAHAGRAAAVSLHRLARRKCRCR